MAFRMFGGDSGSTWPYVFDLYTNVNSCRWMVSKTFFYRLYIFTPWDGLIFISYPEHHFGLQIEYNTYKLHAGKINLI